MERIKRLIAAIRDRLSPPVDFGPYGVLMRDPETQELRPMTHDDMQEMEAEVNLLEEEFWARVELEALRKYGSAVLLQH